MQTPRGRPPLEKEKARRNRVVTFVTDCELAALKRFASAADETLSGACYQLLKPILRQRAPEDNNNGER